MRKGAIAAVVVTSIALAVAGFTLGRHITQKPEKAQTTWCFKSPHNEGIIAYVKGDPKNKYELGNAFLVDHNLTARALAIECSDDGSMWWVDPQSVYNGKIEIEHGAAKIKAPQKRTHARIPEFRDEATAAAENIPAGKKEPDIVIINRNGVLQVLHPEVDKTAIEQSFIIDLAAETKEYGLWPAEKVVLSVLNNNEFAVILIGSKVPAIVHIKWPGGEYTDLNDNVEIRPILIRKKHPEVTKIIAAEPPVFQTHRGGHVSLLTVEKQDGTTAEIDVNLQPKDILLKQRKGK